LPKVHIHLLKSILSDGTFAEIETNSYPT
jgi:hypothetical protein